MPQAYTGDTIKLESAQKPAERPQIWHKGFMPDRPIPLTAGLLVSSAGAYKLGWELRELAGALGTDHGWGALLVFAVLGLGLMVAHSNRSAEDVTNNRDL